MKIDDYRVAVDASAPPTTPPGIIIRFGSAVVLLTNPAAADVLRNEVGDDPAPMDLRDALMALGNSNDMFSTMAAIIEAPAPLVLLRGALSAAAGNVTISGTDQVTEDTLAERGPITLGPRGHSPDHLGASLDLFRGTVNGECLVLVPHVVTEHQAPQVQAPAAAPPPAVFDHVDLRQVERTTGEPLPVAMPAPEPEPEPVPAAPAAAPTPAAPTPAPPEAANDGTEIVHGILCSRQHFNDPRARYCMVCGISMIHLTHNPIPGPRPTLGFVVFDDGATYTLDRSYLLGRDPVPDEPGFDPLVVSDEERQTVSRAHAEIRLSGWDVTVTDLGSTNGSFLWDAERRSWSQLMANSPITLAGGATVAIGRRTFVFESVHGI